MEIVRERLEREFNLESDHDRGHGWLSSHHNRRRKLVDRHPGEDSRTDGEIVRIEEPVIQATMLMPQEYLGGVLKICEEKRGTQKEIWYLGPKRVMLIYELPLNEIVVDFYDRLKSVSRGYASMDYELAGYRQRSGQARRAITGDPSMPCR